MTMTPDLVSCPHCGAQNYNYAPVCHHCGKAMPASVAGGPRILSGGAMPASTAGAKMQGDQYKKQSRKATGSLLAVAILNFVGGAILYALLSNQRGGGAMNDNALMFIVGGCVVFGVLFLALYFWARSSPFIPSLIGLIIYSLATVAIL